MAVNISSSPNEICAIDEPITWGLTISTLGTPGLTQKSIGYQLIDSLGKIRYPLKSFCYQTTG